jgi:membrane-associated phospholipid phosphatase
VTTEEQSFRATVCLSTMISFFYGKLRRSIKIQDGVLLFLVVVLPLKADGHHTWSVDDLQQSSLRKEQISEMGRRPDSIFSRDYVALLADDTRGIFTAPLHWDRNDWLLAGGLTSLVVASATLDHQIQVEATESTSSERHTFTKRAQFLGAEGSFLVLGGFETYGYLADSPRAKAVAMDGVTASIIASGLITPLIKLSAGRARPDRSDHSFDFRPFSGNYSFPSGHTTQAFAVASVIASHYDQWWIQGCAFGLASVVGYARIEQNGHFASDVVAGAIIGTVVGRTIVNRHNKPKEGAVAVTPYFSGEESGIQISKAF